MKTNRKVVQQVIALAFGLLAIVGPIESMAQRGGRGGGGGRGASFHGGGGGFHRGVGSTGGAYRGGAYRGGLIGANRSAAFTGYRGGYHGRPVGGYGNRGYYNRGYYNRGYYGRGYNRYYRPGFGLGYAAGLYGGYGGYYGGYPDNYYDRGYYQSSAGYTEQPVTEQVVTEQPVMQQPVTEQRVMQQPLTEPMMGQPQPGVTQLAADYETVNIGGTMYYFSCGVFFVNENGTFREVDPPAGAVVYNLPAGATQEEINGVGYVVYNNILFTPMTENGRNAYQVIRSR